MNWLPGNQILQYYCAVCATAVNCGTVCKQIISHTCTGSSKISIAYCTVVLEPLYCTHSLGLYRTFPSKVLRYIFQKFKFQDTIQGEKQIIPYMK